MCDAVMPRMLWGLKKKMDERNMSNRNIWGWNVLDFLCVYYFWFNDRMLWYIYWVAYNIIWRCKDWIRGFLVVIKYRIDYFVVLRLCVRGGKYNVNFETFFKTKNKQKKNTGVLLIFLPRPMTILFQKNWNLHMKYKSNKKKCMNWI